MAQPPPTRLHIDPPMRDWQVTPRNGRTKPIIATGHQPTFWHPGILVKYFAADAFAQHIGGGAMHVVVDHNPLGPLAIEMPTQHSNELGAQSLVIGNSTEAALLPPNRLPPIEASSVDRAISGAGSMAVQVVRAGLARITEAFFQQPRHADLAAQVTAVLNGFKQPYLTVPASKLSTSDLVTPGFVDRLLDDPFNCVRCYNRAVLSYPEAGIRPLYAGRDVVELPLWAQGAGVCTPVYADLGDSNVSELFTQGQSLDLTTPDALAYLRPRAITLSAIMRSELCDLFIHGIGGGVYDQITERWWQEWTGEDLAPMAVVSADVYLPFEVPTATQSEYARAQWFAHHLPHNVDRHAEEQDAIDAALSVEKRELLDRMNDDRDRRRRARVFERIHAINAELRQRHDVLIQSARRQAEDARVGVANAEIAGRRDWCFALYPDDQLGVLRQHITASLTR